ncbi:MAG TPA: tRNA (N(6)-L-threonylcarbamoyladenosine(37)-C(2))-methylthiotransferase [archaeon]|nr:tRNA (N(6)-L-threonylcarbamoyladenosine(37)-C(2))-methylthiotransferase [archaeon]
MFKIFIKTFGCTLNQRDSEEIIKNVNYTTDEKEITKANYIIINTCGVKEQTEHKIINYLNKLKQKNILESKIIICGCLVDINPQILKNIFPNANYFKTNQINEINKLFLKKKQIKQKQKSKLTKIVKISNGCLGDCNYCAVKFARGKLKSRNPKEIIDEIKEAINSGAKEIYLTAQDTGCYGLDINTNIVELLNLILKTKGDFKIRLGMGNPQFFIKYYKELGEILKNKKMYKFIHIPLQSGDKEVLKKMNRYYTPEEWMFLVNYFRKTLKNITIATDIIVGYPEETQEQYNNTLKLIQKTKPDIINISRFGRRPGIKANQFNDIKGVIKKQRSRELTELSNKISLENNLKYIGRIKRTLITEIGKGCYIGRTQEYKPVVVYEKTKIGETLKIKIIDAKPHYLIGKTSK